MGSDRGKNEWRSLVRQMVATGYLRLDIAGYGGLGITDKGRALLRGEAEFAAVNGVGVAKLKQFAGRFLAAIEAALADTGDGAPSTEGAR